MEPVGVGRRAVAIIIDSILLMIVFWVIALMTGGTTPEGFSLTGAPALLSFLIGFAYFVVMEKTSGATLGKRGVALQVAHDRYRPGAVADKFGLYHADKGITGRAIIIIDKAGNIAWFKNYGFGEAPSVKEVAEALAKVK